MTIHIQQKGYADCAVACIAMAAEVEYERVLASVPPDVYFYGMYWGEVLHALKKITKKDWTLYIENGDVSLSHLIGHIPVVPDSILFVERDFQYEDPLIRSHYVFVKDGILYDPNNSASPYDEIVKTIVGSWKFKAAIFLEE